MLILIYELPTWSTIVFSDRLADSTVGTEQATSSGRNAPAAGLWIINLGCMRGRKIIMSAA